MPKDLFDDHVAIYVWLLNICAIRLLTPSWILLRVKHVLMIISFLMWCAIHSRVLERKIDFYPRELGVKAIIILIVREIFRIPVHYLCC